MNVRFADSTVNSQGCAAYQFFVFAQRSIDCRNSTATSKDNLKNPTGMRCFLLWEERALFWEERTGKVKYMKRASRLDSQR